MLKTDSRMNGILSWGRGGGGGGGVGNYLTCRGSRLICRDPVEKRQ